jgi:adenylate cyclase
VELRPKSFEVLRYLVEHAGHVASKEEMMAAVWSNVTVTDDSLIRCISEVRHAIGDESQRIVKTVPRRGYLFDAPILPRHDFAETRAGETAQPLRVQQQADPIASDRPSIIVLPFANLSGISEEGYLSDGFSEDIITELSRFSVSVRGEVESHESFVIQ